MKKKRIAKRLLSLMLALSMVLPGMPFGDVGISEAFATENIEWSANDESQESILPLENDAAQDDSETEKEQDTAKSQSSSGIVSEDTEIVISPEDQDRLIDGINGTPGLGKGNKTKSDSRLVEDEKDEKLDEKLEATRPAEDQIVDFMVVLNKAPLLDKFTPEEIRDMGDEVKAYKAELEQLTEAVKGQLSAAFGEEEGFSFGYSHIVATTAVAVSSRYGNQDAIEDMEGVEAVYVAPTFNAAERITPAISPLTSNAPDMIGATEMNNSGYTGKGMKIGIIDTGLLVTHPNFQAMDEGKLTPDSLTEQELQLIWDEETLNASKDNDNRMLAYYSNKVPYVFNYYNRSFDVGHQTAGNDHGTHVAGIAAANKIADSEVVGVAPDAQLLIFQVFTPGGGAEWSTIVAAMEDCVILGVDTANLSLGSAAGFSDGDKEMMEVLSRIENTDTNVLIAGGNDTNNAYMNLLGTDMSKNKFVDNGLVGTPATVPAAIAVASAENDGAVLPYVTVNGQNIGFTDTAVSSETGFLSRFNNKEIPFVIVPGVGDAGDYADLNVEDKIAVVQRGTTSFQEKQQVAKANKAAGLIVYNNVGGTFAMQISDGEGHIPAVSITRADGEKLIAASEEGHDKLKVCDFGETIKVNVDRTMSSFSSWGSTPDLKIKPEITGVGGNIMAPRDPQYAGSYYGNMSGTSMATPQVAGAFAVLQEYLAKEDELKDGELRKITTYLAMSTATQLTEGESLYSVRNQGAGLINIKNATEAGAYFTVPSAFDERPKAEMGDDAERTGKFTFTFRIHHFDDTPQSYTFDNFTMTADIDATGEFMTNTTRKLNPTVVIKDENGDVITGQITLNNEEVKTYLAEITLSEEDKKFIDGNFPYGNYVEGYIYAKSTSDEGVDLSLPFLGFYGDWSDNPIFDDEGEDAQLQPATLLTGKGKLGQNPFIMGGKAGDTYNAISVTNPLQQMTFGLMRNARRIHQRVTSRDGNTEYFSWGEDYMIKTYYSPNYGMIIPYDILYYPDYDLYIWQGTDKDGNALPDGTEVTYTFSTYLDDGDDKVDDTYTFDITIDNTAPVIENKDTLETDIIKDPETGTVKLPISITENHYVAAVIFEDIDGMILGKYEVDNEPGETIDLTFNVTGFGTDFKVIVGDYAANETEVDLSLDLSDMPLVYHDPVALDKGRIYGYETYTDGYVNLGWFSANKEDFSNLRNETFSEYESVISAAEYINGYVVGQRYNDGALILFTPYESYWNQTVIWDQSDKGSTLENPDAIMFYDMAMDYTTNKLYASGWQYKGDGNGDKLDDGHNGLFEITLGENVTVTEIAEIDGMTNSLNAMTLACDDEGQLYTITSEAKLYKLSKTGEMELVGSTGFENTNNYAGVNVIQSMAYDHNTGDTYWYAHSQAFLGGKYVNIGAMYRIDLTTAELTYVGGSGNSGYTSLFIPSDKTADNIKFRVDPTGLEISPATMKIVKGQSRRLSVKWEPWNAVPVAVSWSTKKPEVATVNTNGKVTAVSPGETEIIASAIIGGETKNYKATIEVLQSADDMYGFVITDHNGKIPDSSWITYADSDMNDITKIEGPGGMIQGGTYYEGHVYFVEAEAIPYGPTHTKVYKAEVIKGATNKETKIGEPTLLHTIEDIELGNLGFDYNTGRMYAVDYTYGGLQLIDIDSGENDFLGEFKGDIGGPVIMPAMCVTAEGNIIGSDMFGTLYWVDPDTMETRELGNIGENSWFYAGMTYDYNTGNIYWNPCMGEGLSDMYLVSFTDGENGSGVTDVEIINIGGVGGDKGVEQTVIFTIPDKEPETTYINAKSITITNGEHITYLEGGTMQLNTVTDPVRPSVKPRKWTSNNDEVATVDSKGLVTFKGVGEAIITVEVENKGDNPQPKSVSDTIKVTVHEKAGEFLAFLIHDEGGSLYGDYWITMKDYEVQKSELDLGVFGAYTLRTAEYYDGYIYGFNENKDFMIIDGNNQEKFTIHKEHTLKEENTRVINMAIDYTEGVMYGVTLNKKLVTIDLTNGKTKEVASLNKRIDAIAIDEYGTIFGVGSEEIYQTSYLYSIDKTNGNCTQIEALSTEGGVVYTGPDYYYEQMYSPQMTYDFGTNRLYLNATIRHKTFSSSNKGFFMIQLTEGEGLPDDDSTSDNDGTASGNTSGNDSTSGNGSASGNTSGNTSDNGTVSNDSSQNQASASVYRGRTSFTARIFDAVKKFLKIGSSTEEEPTVKTDAKGDKNTKKVEYISNLGKPYLEIEGVVRTGGDLYLGMLSAIPEEGEVVLSKVTGVRLDRSTVRVAKDKSTTVTATVVPSYLKEDVSRKVTWESEDSNIAEVNKETGEITGKSKGTTTVTATSVNNPEAKATVTVTVVESGEGNLTAYTVSSKEGAMISFNPELPSEGIKKELGDISSGSYVAGITKKDENTLYYLVANPNESGHPWLYTYDIRTGNSTRLSMLNITSPNATDIAYDPDLDILYVVVHYSVFQFQAKKIPANGELVLPSLQLELYGRQDVSGENAVHGVAVGKNNEVYLLTNNNGSSILKVDNKFQKLEKVGDVGVNTVHYNCELEYVESTDTFYMTDGGSILYSFDIKGTEEGKKVQNFQMIDMVINGNTIHDINGLCIVENKKTP